MKRWVYAYRTVAGKPEDLEAVLQKRAPALLTAVGEPVAESADLDGSIGVRLAAPVPGVPAKTVRIAAGVASRADGRLRIPLRWHAEPGRAAFPEFDGALELQPLSQRAAQLTIIGACTVPLGHVGAAVDATLLAGAAQRTAKRIIDRLADALIAAAASPAPGRRVRTALGAAPRVADVMTADPVLLAPDLPLRAAALLLLHRRIRGAPVVADSGELVGVLSETDILATEATPAAHRGRGGASALTVGEACTRPARVTVADAALTDAAREMLRRGVGRLVVVEGSRIVGIATRHDVLNGLLRSDVEVHAAVVDALDVLAEGELTAVVRWGVVTLSGPLSEQRDLDQITAAVEQIPGVAAVRLNLRPGEVSRSEGIDAAAAGQTLR